MKIDAPKPVEQSRTVALAKLNKILFAAIAAVNVVGATAILTFVPEQYREPAGAVLLMLGAVGAAAGAPGAERIILARLERGDLLTAAGKAGPTLVKDAEAIVHATQGELARLQLVQSFVEGRTSLADLKAARAIDEETTAYEDPADGI